MSFVIDAVNLLENYVYVAIPIVSIILLFISYLISNKIYKNKEF
jgi:TRAP-type C4-dicarboxylate transport system permease small subunit